MNPEAINFYSKKDKPKGVETFFFEGNPAPVHISEKQTDSSVKFLDRFIYENVIEQTGALPKERLKGAFGWARNNITIGSVVKWGLMILIAAALIQGWLFG